MSVNNDLFENEAQRFNLIANNIDRFGEIIETISDENIKNNAKSILSQIENLVLESPEWILNTGVSGVNIGIFGAVKSGWKELISVFIDSQEQDYYEDMGIRLKHVIKLSDESKHLLLLRRDGEIIPDVQFSTWVHCGVFLFGLENERTFKEALLSHKELISLRSNEAKLCPTILVGCQDGVTESSPRLKSFIELQEIRRNYGFDEYFEVRNENGFNTFFLFEYCTLIAKKAIHGKSGFDGQRASHLTDDNDLAAVKKRKNNKRKTSDDDDFKIPRSTAMNSKKTAKNAKRTSSICDTNERRLSFSMFRSKNRSLPRFMSEQGGSGSFSSSSSICDLSIQYQAQITYVNLSRLSVSMIQLPPRRKQSRWRFFNRKKLYYSKENLAVPQDSIIYQGILYKGRHKKWVTITNDAKMFYNKSKQDYLNGVTPKYIDLQFSNARVPGNSSQNGHFSRSTKRGGQNNRKNSDQEDKRLIIINTQNGKNQCITREYRALSEQERDIWMTVITDAIFHHYERTKIDRNPSMHVTTAINADFGLGTVKKTFADSVDVELTAIRQQFGNDKCAECTASQPDWLVFNIGILVCDRCAGGHRQLGVEISKVCSLRLDSLDEIKILIAREYGNYVVNSVLEARLPLTNDCKPCPESPSIDEWLLNKYVRRKYIPPLPLPHEYIQKQLMFAIQERDRRYQLVCLMNSSGTQLNLPYDPITDTRTALMIATRIGDIVAVQLLLWAGVDPSVKDAEGLNAFSFTYDLLDTNVLGVGGVGTMNNQSILSNSDPRMMLKIQELLKRFKTPVQLLVTSGPTTPTMH